MKDMEELDALIAECDEAEKLIKPSKERQPGAGRPVGTTEAVRRARMDELAKQMRDRNLNQGQGCKTRARAIAARVGR